MCMKRPRWGWRKWNMANPIPPACMHNATSEIMCVDGHKPRWVHDDPSRRGFVMAAEAADGELCVGKAAAIDTEVVSNDDHQTLQTVRAASVALLKACAQNKDLCKGSRIHTDILKRGLLKNDPFVASTLIHMYAKCGALAKAQQVLDELPVRDVVIWSALIAGYAQQGQGEEALSCFERMQRDGFSPNIVTFVCILKACGSTGTAEKGKQIHDEILRQGLLGKDIVLGNALVDMYAKCGLLAKAQQVLVELPIRDTVTWNALIGGYAQQGQCQEALKCFKQMQREGLSPDTVTFAGILKACGHMRAVEIGEQIHDEIVCQGLVKENSMLGNALVDMYAKCGALLKAQRVLDELPVRNIVAWSALIAGYSQQEDGEEAVNCFERMQREGLSPDAVTFACILKACGSIGAADKGKQIHDEIVCQGLLGKDCVLATALVDMYSKCGELAEAQQVLDELPVRDVVSWNALISGYAFQVQGEAALNCLGRMQGEGLSPNVVTFTCILNVCSRACQVEKGQMCLRNMSRNYGITPDMEHYTCLVDLFGRAGHFEQAVSVINKMPSANFPPVWCALLGACRKWGNVELGKWAFEHAIQVC